MRYKKNKKNSLLVDRAVEFILTRNIDELGALTEEKIAGNLKVQTSYLSETFKNEQNIALKRFITREKIHRAIFILEKNQELSIEEISNKLGFPGSDDFVMEFQEYLAIDPH
ncbi:MAG TPA: helix-turn-helix domain-containing protein, partial [Candidatus Kapabacteria bacterium]|nr:helix-turn-helix domain-containing protein [Candidatus Kapabacteria bacterium]